MFFGKEILDQGMSAAWQQFCRELNKVFGKEEDVEFAKTVFLTFLLTATAGGVSYMVFCCLFTNPTPSIDDLLKLRLEILQQEDFLEKVQVYHQAFEVHVKQQDERYTLFSAGGAGAASSVPLSDGEELAAMPLEAAPISAAQRAEEKTKIESMSDEARCALTKELQARTKALEKEIDEWIAKIEEIQTGQGAMMDDQAAKIRELKKELGTVSVVQPTQ